MRCIFNAPYSPDYNPIEGVFSVAKRKIKQERLKDIMSKRKRELEGLIKD